MEVEQYPQEYLEATILKRRLGGAPTSRLKSKLLLEVQEHYYMFHMECESKSSCILQETWDLERVCWKVRYSRNESNTKELLSMRSKLCSITPVATKVHMILRSFVVLTWMCDTIELV